MAGNVEAKSLSDLNALADNPPQYPVKPTETPRESLTLYISRVPGSRDVILSPLKPQVKNVTGRDIMHSLYYVHLDLPSEEQTVVRKSGVEKSPQVSIPRKPLPTTAKVSRLETRPHDSGPVSPSRSLVNLPADSNVPPLKTPIPGSARQETVYDAPSLDQAGNPTTTQTITRRPLGPRPIGAPQLPVRDGQHLLASPPLTAPETPTPPAAALKQSTFSPPRPSTSDSAYDATPFPLLRSLSPSKHQHRPIFTPYSLTLIRRNPTSGEQKNVARMASFQTNIPTPEMADPSLSADNMPRPEPPTINIRIETLGYAKFGNWPTRAALERFAAEGNLNLQPGETIIDGPGRRSRGTSFNIPVQPEQGFNRQVKMAYAKTWTSNIKSAFHIRQRSHERRRSEAEEDNLRPDELAPPRAPAMQGHQRHRSTGSTGSAESLDSASGRLALSGTHGGRSSFGDAMGSSPTSPSSPVITRPGPGLRPKGYVFASPWDGRCEFRTGSRGRSLECRHVLGSSSAGFETATEGAGASGTRPVSELRFNLPGGSDGGGGTGHGHTKHGLHGKFDKLLKLDPRNRQDDSDEDDEGDVALDLSLGREKAGGGSRGNRAKLGKLIIHDEGQKFIDLVVAANIGVWWATWEKASL